MKFIIKNEFAPKASKADLEKALAKFERGQKEIPQEIKVMNKTISGLKEAREKVKSIFSSVNISWLIEPSEEKDIIRAIEKTQRRWEKQLELRTSDLELGKRRIKELNEDIAKLKK